MSTAKRLAAVGLLALGLRVGYVLTYSKGAGELATDAEQYHSLAVHLVQEGRYVDNDGNRLFRMPGYPVFLAGIYELCGPSVLAAQLAQAFLGALGCLCLYAAARKLYGEEWGLVCGLAAAVYRGLIAPCTYIMTESVVSSLLCAFIWLWYCGDGVPAAAQSLALAVTLATACIVRPDLGPFVLALGFFLPKFSPRFKPRHALLWIPISMALLSPWIIRNYLTFHQLMISGTQGQAASYFGLALPLQALHDIDRAEVFPPGMPELEQKAFYVKKFAALWSATPLRKILRAYFFNVATMFYPFLPQYDWGFMLLVPFWLWALRRLRMLPQTSILWTLVILYVAVHAFSGGPVSRYRETISAPLVLLAVAGAQDLRARLGPRFWKWAGGYATLNALVWLLAPQTRQAALWLKAALFRHGS